jgi:hypothetical protein
VFQKIRSLDSTARIAGPNFTSYRSADLRSFLTYAKANGNASSGYAPTIDRIQIAAPLG